MKEDPATIDLEPCYELLMAILERALKDAISEFGFVKREQASHCEEISRADRREALLWLKETDERDVEDPFTFLGLCDALRIPPERIRMLVKAGRSDLLVRKQRRGYKQSLYEVLAS